MPRIEADLLNPFITASTSVFSDLTGIELEKASVERKEMPDPSFRYAILLGIVGELEGQVTYSLSKDLSREVVKGILGDMLPAVIDRNLTSGLGELGNMITGNAARQLEEQGVNIDISPPSVIEGDDYTIEYVNLRTIRLVMISNRGTLEINLALVRGDSE